MTKLHPKWNNAVICCIAKNEENYIIEWILYHLEMGFYRIYIYDNNNNKNQLPKYLSKHRLYPLIKKKIRIIYFPGKMRQFLAYNHFVKYVSHLWRWVAILDCDEFITIKDLNLLPISKFLSKHCRQGSLAIHWRLFGGNGHTKYQNKNVTNRFTKCERNLNVHVKCISVCNHISNILSPHNPLLKNQYKQHDCLGRLCNGPLNNIGLDEPNVGIYINHYFCKSIEEWNHKRNKGMADNLNIRSDNEYEPHNKNEIEDLFANNFYKKFVMKRIDQFLSLNNQYK
jgi:hypothetical protein